VLTFWTKTDHFAFLSHPPWGLRATHTVHLKLIGKLVVDFQLVLIELFSLGVTAEVTSEY